MSLAKPLDYSQLGPAAIQAAAKLVEAITITDYNQAGTGIPIDAFAVARWKALSIGNLAVTILQTMQFRDEIAGGLEAKNVKFAKVTPGNPVTVQQEFHAFSEAKIDKVPPCTTP